MRSRQFVPEVLKGEVVPYTGLTPYARDLGMSDDEVFSGVEEALRKYFGKRGERVVRDNLTCVKRGYQEMQGVPAAIIQGTTTPAGR